LHPFCLLVCRRDGNTVPANDFACKFQGTLEMGQKVIIRFWWESGLSSASTNHLNTFADLSCATHV